MLSTSSDNGPEMRREPSAGSQVFVSRHFQLEPGELEAYLERRELEYRASGRHLIVKECPFCPSHKNDPSNLWKLYIWRDNGHCYCHRCGANYTYFEFKRRVSSTNHEVVGVQRHDGAGRAGPAPLSQAKAFESRTRLFADPDALRYLVQERHLNEDVIRKYGVGAAEITFRDSSTKEKCLTFPWAYLDDDRGFGPLHVDRLKYRSLSRKSNQILEPRGGPWGLFGWHTVPASATQIVITEGEFDAMSVHQETGMPAVSLPNGAHSFPIDILPCLERFQSIIIWMDDDAAGRVGASKFARKVGLGRVRVVQSRAGQDSGPKDANEALVQGLDLKAILDTAAKPSHGMIVRVGDLRNDVYNEIQLGVRYRGIPFQSIPSLQAVLKGHRRGELTVITGPTGLGKTTVLAQLSLDLCLQGASTLWGSFEIQNQRLVQTMLAQCEARDLDGIDRAAFDQLYERFATMPLYFLKFFSVSALDDVMEALEFAVYVHDVDHILLDNLQFMLGSGVRGPSKFDQQDEAIARLRHFASSKNVHVSLVIHPRKEAPGQPLSVVSVSGTGKATQEADNVLILQPCAVSHEIRYLAVAKNRFDGDLGRIPYRFDRGCRRQIELNSFEKNQLRVMLKTASMDQTPPVFVPSTDRIPPMWQLARSKSSRKSSSDSKQSSSDGTASIAADPRFQAAFDTDPETANDADSA